MDPDADYPYSAFEKWPYKSVFFKTDNTRTWLGVADGYYEASRLLVEGLANGKFSEDIEGIIAVFLFRHYLELSLKRIIVEGRWLNSVDKNARATEVAELKRTHHLGGLWEKVIADAQPKIPVADWNGYDVDFVKKCVFEFDRVDPNGEAYRYDMEGAENYQVSYQQLATNIVHVHQVLEGIISYLVNTYGQNAEWQAILNSY
jgi:hypothetical protein